MTYPRPPGIIPQRYEGMGPYDCGKTPLLMAEAEGTVVMHAVHHRYHQLSVRVLKYHGI